MPVIKPSIGRVVWFYPKGHKEGDQPRAAIIAHVHSDHCVNLAIFDSHGNAVINPPTSVMLLDPDSVPPGNECYATWMPYQKGQAQKTEAAEQALAAQK